MASRLALHWSSSGVLLVALASSPSGSAQGALPFEPEAGREPIRELESTRAVAFEGVVYDPSGAPAEGAVVVSSAGGQAATDRSGSYRLEARVPLEAECVQITAVGRAGSNLSASSRVPLLATSGPMRVGQLQLAQGGTCSPSWLPTFGDPDIGGWVNALTVFDDGGGPALYVAGYFLMAGGVMANRIAKWDGSTWEALGGGLGGPYPEEVLALAVFDDGGGPALYAGGSFTTAGGVAANYIAKWDGSSWSALGSGIGGSSSYVHALTVFDDGGGPALCAGGYFTSVGGVAANHIAKWDGSSWSALGSGFNNGVSALTVFDGDGGPALYAGGYFTTAGGVAANRIAKWDGVSWAALGSGVNSSVLALTMFDDGGGPALYAGGQFGTAGGVSANCIAKWDGSSWAPLGTGMSGMSVFTGVYALTVFDDGGGPALYAGGHFDTAGGVLPDYIAKWDGSSWSTLSGGGVSAPVTALAVFDDGGGLALYVGGGNFPGSYGYYIKKWNGSSWVALSNGPSGSVHALTLFDDGGGPALYAGGSFTSAGGVVASRIAKWDGSSWAALGSGVNSTVYALTVFDDGGGPALYAGGNFTNAAANYIAKWDSSSWATLGSGVDDTVYALTVFDDGGGPALYAGGSFTTAGGVAASRIAKWDGSSWAALGSGMGGASPYVGALMVFDDGGGPALYAAGKFQSAGSLVTKHIAKWDGSSWAALGSVTGSAVVALTVFDDGGGPALYAGGGLTTAGGVAASGIAKWDGSSWAALGSGVGGLFSPSVEALTVFDDGGGPALYAGGSFTTAGGVAASRIAEWDGSSWAALGSGMTNDVYALTAFDDGSGLAALFAGGSFYAIDSGDGNLAKWGCPITSSGIAYCTAGTTTHGCVPAISGTGDASASAGSGFTLSIAEVEGQKAALLFYGVTGAKAAPWGTGTSYLCIEAPLKRMSKQSSGGTAGACDGVFFEDWNAYIAAHPDALGQPFVGGETVWAQGWFRDPSAPKATNLSDALVFSVSP